jgi:hypothetical protein
MIRLQESKQIRMKQREGKSKGEKEEENKPFWL